MLDSYMYMLDFYDLCVRLVTNLTLLLTYINNSFTDYRKVFTSNSTFKFPDIRVKSYFIGMHVIYFCGMWASRHSLVVRPVDSLNFTCRWLREKPKELTQENISYTSDQGKTYDFNTADKLNALLIKALVSTGELNEVESYDVDFDHQFLETEKYDAKPFKTEFG